MLTHRWLPLRAGFDQLASFFKTPLRSASKGPGHTESVANLSASDFLVPITLRAAPVNATSNQAAAASGAAAGRRLLQTPPTVPQTNSYDVFCARPAVLPHALAHQVPLKRWAAAALPLRRAVNV